MGNKSWKSKKLKKYGNVDYGRIRKYACDNCNQLTIKIPRNFFFNDAQEGDKILKEYDEYAYWPDLEDYRQCSKCEVSYSISKYCKDHDITFSKENYPEVTEKSAIEAQKKQERKVHQEYRQTHTPDFECCPNCNKHGVSVSPFEVKSDLFKNPLVKKCKFCNTKCLLKSWYPDMTNTAPGHEEYNGRTYEIVKLLKGGMS